MDKVFTATIFWKTHEEGGRRGIPPEGTRYAPLIKIGEIMDWSIFFICPDFEKTNIIEFCFASEAAPDELICDHKDYGIYEGEKQVATVHIESSEECTRPMIIQSFGKSGYGPQE